MSDHEDYGGEDEAFGDDLEFDENDLIDGEGDVEIVDDEEEENHTGAFG